MYSKLKKYVTACCAMLLVSFYMIDAKAAVASEEENESTESTEVINPNTIDLDVPSYLVRYLYREPDADEINIKHWYDGWGWMMYWNPDVLGFGATSYVNRFNMSAKGLGLALSKDFNKMHGVRIGANFSSVSTQLKDEDEKELQRVNVSLDYIWNLSSTYYGYDTHRTDEWLLTAGFKGGKILNEGGDYFGSVNLGLQYRKNIANDMSFFVEPQFAFFTDQYDNNKTFYEVDPGLNVLVGLYFRMGQPKMDIYKENNNLFENLFFQALGGVVNGSKVVPFNSPNLVQKDYQRHGMNFGFNVGGWFNPSLGIRTGYFENVVGQANNKILASNGFKSTAAETYRGGRVEVVMNPITILTNKTSIARFGIDFSVGYEAGVLNKHNEKYDNTWTVSGPEGNHINYFASGVTFATQLKYFMSPNYAFFAEGRYSNPMYYAKAADGLKEKGNISDELMSWAVGMEYYISAFERYKRFPWLDDHQSPEITRLDNDHRWYIEVAGGLGFPTHAGENFKARRGLALSASLGMYANDYNGFRLRAGAVRKFLLSRGEGWDYNIQGLDYQTTLALDYTLNVTNLWWGVDDTDTRWSELYFFAGPMVQIDPHNFRQSVKGKTGYGFEVGTQLTRRVSPSVELFAEPRYEWQMHAADRWNFMAGLKLYQNKEKNFHYRDSVANHDKRSFFMEVAGGAGLDVTGSYGMLKQHVEKPDYNARLGVGYRINPISSVRASLTLTQFGKPDGTTKQRYNYNGTRTAEASIDYMANLVNLWYGNNPHRIFQLQGYIGALVNPDRILSPECTTDIAYDWKLGVQGGLQLLYTPFQNVGFFVEPRLSYYLSDYIVKSGAEYHDYKRDEHFDVFAGLIFYNQPETLSKRGYNTTKVDSARTWYYEMALGGAFTPSGRKGLGHLAKGIAPTGYVGIGHYMNNLSSMRLRLGLVNILNPEYVAYDDKFVTSVSLDYMYNLTNRAMGVNPYRRFDLSLYGGPVLEYHNSEIHNNDVWDKGINLGGQLSWHMNNYLDIFGEARAIMSMAHHTRYEALAGVKFYQNTEKSQQFKDSAAQHAYTWFMEVAGGAGKSLTGAQEKLDGTGKLAVGYRFNPISSVRFSGLGWVRQENHEHFGRGEFSLDYMANLFNIWYGVNPYRRVNLRGFVGPALTLDYFVSTKKNLKLNAAYTAGIQTTVGLTDNIDFLLEPRFVGVLSGDEKNRLDGYAGLIFYNQRGKMEADGYDPIDTNNERGWFMDLAGGVSFAPDGRARGIKMHVDPIFNFAVGHNFGNYSAVRARAGIGYIRNITTNKTQKTNPRWMPEVALDYIHNVTNHLLGINPYRRFDFSLFAGPMVEVKGIIADSPHPTLAVNGGAEVAWHVNNFVDIYAEPRVNYFLNEDYYSRFSALAGVRLYQNKTNNIQNLDSPAKHGNTWFLEAGLGAGTLLADQNNPDFATKLAVGYRYSQVSSLRLSARSWARSIKNSDYNATGAEFTLDYLANLPNILYGVNPDRKFNINAFIGGLANPENYLAFEKELDWNYGINVGLQATYAISDNIDFMLEPRIAKFINGSATQTPRGDVYAGLIFYNQRGLANERGWESTDIEDKNTWFVELGGGLSFSPDARLDDGRSNHIDKNVHAALGVHFNNYSSLRGRSDITFVNHRKQTKAKRSLLPEIGLDYMFNLSNALMGVNPYRRFDVNIFAGPLARLKGLTDFSDLGDGLGVNMGSQLSWHINDRWDLFGEGRVNIYKNYDSRIEGLLGLAYRFNKSSVEEASYGGMSDNRLYAQVLAGAQITDIEKFKVDGLKGYSSLPTINYNIGYHFNKLLGMQFGFYSNHLSVDVKNKQTDAYNYGVRLEGVAGIMNMFNPSYDPYESRFNWTGSAGIQTGRTLYESLSPEYSFGVTAATQLQYRVFSHSWALFELRAQSLRAKKGMAIPVAAQLGLMYDFHQFDDNNTSASKWYIQAGSGMIDSKSGMMQFALGVDATPVHGFRVSFDKSFDEIDAAGELMSISPDYLLNLTNIFFKHDDNQRHVDFSLLLGADYQLYNKDGSAKNSVNVNAGAQVAFNINKNWQIYTEPRLSFAPKSDKVGELKHDGLNIQTTIGLKYHLPSFKK